MGVNKFQLASQAMILVGGKRVVSFAGTTTEQIVASDLYEPAVIEILCMYRWRFASVTEQLSRTDEATPLPWTASYVMPSEQENVHGVKVNGHQIDFDRYQDRVRCDALETDVVEMDFTYRCLEAHWPGYFATALRFKLASLFAIPIAESVEKADFYEKKFIAAFRMGKNIDAQGRTAKQLPVGRLRAYHRGRP